MFFLSPKQVFSRWYVQQQPQRHPMDLHAPGHVRAIRLQRSWLPEEAHLRGHEGARILRICCQEVQDRIPVSTLCFALFCFAWARVTWLFCFVSFQQIRQVPRGLSTSPTTWGNFSTSTWTPTRLLRTRKECSGVLQLPILHQGHREAENSPVNPRQVKPSQSKVKKTSVISSLNFPFFERQKDQSTHTKPSSLNHSLTGQDNVTFIGGGIKTGVSF